MELCFFCLFSFVCFVLFWLKQLENAANWPNLEKAALVGYSLSLITGQLFEVDSEKGEIKKQSMRLESENTSRREWSALSNAA